MLIVPPNSRFVRSAARAESLPGMRRLGWPMWSVALAPIASAATSTSAHTPSVRRACRIVKRAIALNAAPASSAEQGRGGTAPPGCGA